jgi:MOSC domain-containing protein YiiM
MTFTGRIVSLQVGMPRTERTETGRLWESAIVKSPVAERVALGEVNLAGDEQADRRHHGGPDKAVCCYSAEHYPDWRALLFLDLLPGAFGENFTTEGLTEERVCIGDTFTAGSALVQISQPRQPCANISRRWGRPDLPRRMEQNGRTGFYLRVLQTGEVSAGDALTLVERPHPGWTLLRANAAIYAADADPAERAALGALGALSAEWKRMLGRRPKNKD